MDIFLKNINNEDLSLDSEGRLKLLDNTQITSLDTYILNYKKQLFFNNLAYQRKMGNCYCFSASSNTSSYIDDFFEIFNNTTTKNIYIYKIMIKTSNSSTADERVYYNINKITTPSTGGTTNYSNTSNQKLDGPQLSESDNIIIKLLPTADSTKTRLYRYHVRVISGSGIFDYFDFSRNHDEMIQIPPGYGINIDYENITNTDNIQNYFNITIRFLVMEGNYPEYNPNNITL